MKTYEYTYPEMRAMRAECEELQKKVAELQQRNTELVEQRRAACIRTNVLQFHRVIDQPVLHEPQVPSEERVRFRLSLIAEEFIEVLDACGVLRGYMADTIMPALRTLNTATLRINLPELADGLCDLDYVVEGTRLEFGIDGRPVLAEVQRANLLKAGGPRRADGKILKPEGWQPPDIARVLRDQGWRG